MSSERDLEEMDTDIQEVLESDDTPPEAFYLALRNALAQLEHQAPAAH